MTPKNPEFAALEQSGWAEAATAASYAAGFAAAADACVPVFVRQGGAAPGRHLLDLCCGHGNVCEGLVGAGAQVTGLDFSPAMLALARRRVPGARFVQGDAAALPFDDASFDGATMGFGMPHLPDPPAAIAEARRVLRPGARFAFSVWQGPEVEGAFGWVFGAIASHGDPAVTLPPGPGANDYAEVARAYPALEAAGFADCACEVVASQWQVDDPAAPFDFFDQGTVRGGAMLRPQSPAHRAAIRAEVVRRVIAALGSRGPWTVPIPSVVISATAAGSVPTSAATSAPDPAPTPG